MLHNTISNVKPTLQIISQWAFDVNLTISISNINIGQNDVTKWVKKSKSKCQYEFDIKILTSDYVILMLFWCQFYIYLMSLCQHY